MNPNIKPSKRPGPCKSHRRILLYLHTGGRLRRVRCNAKGSDVRRPDPDPKRHYFMLYPNLGEGGIRGYSSNKPPRVWTVSKDTLRRIVAAEYLKPETLWRSRDEAGPHDLTDKGRQALELYGWNRLPTAPTIKQLLKETRRQ